jgi:hypothetical protein
LINKIKIGLLNDVIQMGVITQNKY